MESNSPRFSPLDSQHRALNARMVEFGGWEMPIQYSGVLEEHRSCRSDAVVFDVSHLGSLRVAGPTAKSVLQWAFTNDLDRISPGRAQYTHLLDAADAHVVDDVIIWWVSEDEFLVMPNASNTQRLTAALQEAVLQEAGDCLIEDNTDQRVMLAVQGPRARDYFSKFLADELGANYPEKFTVSSFPVRDHTIVAAGTGYTGEDGIELHIPLALAAQIWEGLLAAGVTPAGLGARDTLRLEAGLPLHGYELGAGITSAQAGLSWVVRPDKGEFRGRTAYLAEQKQGLNRRLQGLRVKGRQIPRHGCPVERDGAAIGEVTSGNFSPMLNGGIALAFLPPDTEVGSEVDIVIRDRRITAVVTKPPFFIPGFTAGSK